MKQRLINLCFLTLILAVVFRQNHEFKKNRDSIRPKEELISVQKMAVPGSVLFVCDGKIERFDFIAGDIITLRCDAPNTSVTIAPPYERPAYSYERW